jgi:DNA polymerase I-like protein with 3'-5' exonuclease and polymerase domains
MQRSLPKFLTDLNPEIFLSNNYVVLDFETDTSHGDYGHPVHKDNQLLLACWNAGPGHPWNNLLHRSTSVKCEWGNELEQSNLLHAISLADFLVCHGCKYELGWLKRMGADLRQILVFDTMLGEYVLLGNLVAGSAELGMPPRSVNLDTVCRRRGLPVKDPAVDIMIHNGINPVSIPRPWLQGRCQQDVETTEQVFLSQRIELQKRGLLPVQFTRCLLTPVLADIEQEGMAVDPEAVNAEYKKYSAKLVEQLAEMDKLTGGINPRSVPQMAKFLYSSPKEGGLGFKELANKQGEPKRNAPSKQFPDGQPLTDNKTLDKLTATTARQRAFLSLRKELGKTQAILSKNLEFFRGVAEEYGGVFYGEINQTRTATHRTSSSGVPLVFRNQLDDSGKPIERRVQFQNFPRLLKKLLRAKRPGWLIGEPDGSQIEFRVAAVLGNDEQAIADITDPTFDAHLLTASVLHNCSIDDVKREKKEAQAMGRDDWRQLAKPDTYKPLYGGKYGTPEQERYYAYFRNRYHGIAKTQEQWVNEAVETKRLVTPWGLIYYWPTARRDSRGRVNVESAVDNYPVQALATAEIVPIAVVYLWHRIGAEGLDERIRIVNLVHDSAPSEIHPEAQQDFKRLSKQAFTHDVYNYLSKVYGFEFDKVPLGIGLKIGEHWGEGPEESWDIYRDGREVKRK